MARPSKNLTSKLPETRISEAQEQRLLSDATEAGLTRSALIRRKLFSTEALAAGKGMSRHEHLNCLRLIADIRKIIGNDRQLNDILDKLADSHYKATQDDKQGS